MSKEMLIFVSIPYFLMVAYFLKGRTLTIFVPQFYNQLIISHSYTLHRLPISNTQQISHSIVKALTRALFLFAVTLDKNRW